MYVCSAPAERIEVWVAGSQEVRNFRSSELQNVASELSDLRASRSSEIRLAVPGDRVFWTRINHDRVLRCMSNSLRTSEI